MIKERIPKNIKIKIHLLKNLILDFKKGYLFSYAKKRKHTEPLIEVFSLTQDLKSNEFKKHNLETAKGYIEPILIFPNEIFSFWKSIGNPIKKRGFVQSRSLVNGVLEQSYGGGLCQLSGLIYLVSLHGGLKILERHNHSVDIYDDTTRYMPLGGDATVAFGYKDLKIRNNLKKPIKFIIDFSDTEVTVALQHTESIPIHKVQFSEKNKTENTIEMSTLINDQEIVTSTYKKI